MLRDGDGNVIDGDPGDRRRGGRHLDLRARHAQQRSQLDPGRDPHAELMSRAGRSLAGRPRLRLRAGRGRAGCCSCWHWLLAAAARAAAGPGRAGAAHRPLAFERARRLAAGRSARRARALSGAPAPSCARSPTRRPVAGDPALARVADWRRRVPAPPPSGQSASRRPARALLRGPGSSPIWSPTTANPQACSPATTSRCCTARAAPAARYTGAAARAAADDLVADRSRPLQPGPRRLCDLRPDRRPASSCPTTRAPRSTPARSTGAASSCSGSTTRSPSSSCRSRARARSGSTTARCIRVGYAAQNGHPYRAIGRDLIEIGALTREEVSLQSDPRLAAARIPRRRAAIMARNRSYVFFREHPELDAADGPLGAAGRAAHRRPLARGRPPLHAARRAGLARHHRALARGRRRRCAG